MSEVVVEPNFGAEGQSRLVEYVLIVVVDLVGDPHDGRCTTQSLLL